MSVVRLAVLAIGALACASASCSSSTGGAEELGESADQAYTGAVPDMLLVADGDGNPASWPGAPASWPQPASEGIFDLQNFAYCGPTAAANLLRWYGEEVTPRQAIDDGCWSIVGTRPAAMIAYLRAKHGELGCGLSAMAYDVDALAAVRAGLHGGRPFVILFMTGALAAHWVTVIGVEGEGPDPFVVVMSWGRFYRMQWSKLRPAWRAAYGGPYTFIICRDPSPLADGIRVDG